MVGSFVGMRSRPPRDPTNSTLFRPFPFSIQNPPVSLCVCLDCLIRPTETLFFFFVFLNSIPFIYFRKFTLWHHQKLTQERNRHKRDGVQRPPGNDGSLFFSQHKHMWGQRLEQQQLLAMIMIIITLSFLPCRNVVRLPFYLPAHKSHRPTHLPVALKEKSRVQNDDNDFPRLWLRAHQLHIVRRRHTKVTHAGWG